MLQTPDANGLLARQSIKSHPDNQTCRDMWRFIGIVGLTLLLCDAEDAWACSAGIPYDPGGMLEHDIGRLSQDDIIASLPEVVVEGVIAGDPMPVDEPYPYIEGLTDSFLYGADAVP